MAHSVEALVKAVRDHWRADSNLSAVIASPHYGRTQRKLSYPYGTFRVVFDQPETFMDQGPIEEMALFFDLFDDGRDHATILDAATKLQKAFDDAVLSFSGLEYTPVSLIRISGEFLPEGQVWRWQSQYEVQAFEN